MRRERASRAPVTFARALPWRENAGLRGRAPSSPPPARRSRYFDETFAMGFERKPTGGGGQDGGLSLLRPHGPPRSPQATPSRRPRSTALHGARAPLPGAGARSPRGLASADGGLGPRPLAAQPGEQPSQPGGVRRRTTWHGLRGAARCSGGPCSSDSRARPFGVGPCGWASRLRAHRPVSRPVPGANAPAGGDTLASGGGGELPHHSAPPGAPQPGRTLPRPHPSPQRGPTL